MAAQLGFRRAGRERERKKKKGEESEEDGSIEEAEDVPDNDKGCKWFLPDRIKLRIQHMNQMSYLPEQVRLPLLC